MSEEKKLAEEYEELSCSCPEMPQLDFGTFVLSMSSSALVYLGEVPEPETGQVMENVLAAKQTIDILCMLESKTRGNLTDQEARLLRDMLFELRMKYVQKREIGGSRMMKRVGLVGGYRLHGNGVDPHPAWPSRPASDHRSRRARRPDSPWKRFIPSCRAQRLAILRLTAPDCTVLAV